MTCLRGGDRLAVEPDSAAHGKTVVYSVRLRLVMAEAFRELRRLHAKVPIILCSGYAELEVKQQFASAGLTFNGFIQKPYRFNTMVQSVKLEFEGGIVVSCVVS